MNHSNEPKALPLLFALAGVDVAGVEMLINVL